MSFQNSFQSKPHFAYVIGARIIKLLITETGTYNNQYFRPYVTNLDHRALNEVLERTSKVNTITPGLFSGISSSIISPSPDVHGAVHIPDGWNEPRYRFMMEIEFELSMGERVFQVITGYSNDTIHNQSIYGTLDPNMTFRVNNSIDLKKTTAASSHGNTSYVSVMNYSNVLSDSSWKGLELIDNNLGVKSPTYMMRPTEVLTQMNHADLSLISDGNVVDTTNILSSRPILSKKSYNNTDNFLADAIGSYLKSSNVANTTFGYNSFNLGDNYIHDDLNESRENSKITNAVGYLGDKVPYQDKFLNVMANINDSVIGVEFMLKDLKRLDPNVDAVTTYIKKSPVHMSTVHSAGQTANWHGSDINTHIANVVSQAVISMMAQYAITEFYIVGGNLDAGGTISSRIGNIRGFTDGIDLTPYAQSLQTQFENNVLRDIIQMYYCSLGVTINANMLGETWIKVIYNGEEYDYVLPSFADALMPPVLAKNPSHVSSFNDDMRLLIRNIEEYSNLNNMNPEYDQNIPILESNLNYSNDGISNPTDHSYFANDPNGL